MTTTTAAAAARGFARSLNILLKYTRLYGWEHQRTSRQFETAWSELKAACGGETGLLLGVAEGKLLLDGVPIEGQAERSFAALLTTAGVGSIHFAPQITSDEFARCVKAFTTGKQSDLVEQIKAATGNGNIHVNEIKFVAQDPASEGRASELVAQALGPRAGSLANWLSDPEKLLQLIAAAEGSQGGGNLTSAGGGPGTGRALDDPTVHSVLRILAKLGGTTDADPEVVIRELKAESRDTLEILRQLLASLPALTEAGEAPSLATLAEKLAIRFALQQYERGDVKINAVHDMLARMGQQIESLRSVLSAHEAKMNRAGMMVESYADILDRQFWAAMPERGKNSVLLSPDAWCIPPRNVKSYVEELVQRSDHELAARILRNYVRQLENDDPEARRKTAMGISELAGTYAQVAADLPQQVMAVVGARLCSESGLEMQTLLGAAYVRLSQEAAKWRDFGALRQSLNTLEHLHEYRPRTAAELRPRVAVENRLGEFIADAVKELTIPAGLPELLRRVPAAAAEQIALQFSRCELREHCDRYVKLAQQAGDGVWEYLVAMLRSGAPGEASRAAGVLSRLLPVVTEAELKLRVGSFARPQQDAVVRQLAAGGAAGRGRILVALLDLLDPLVVPEALDEIGLAAEPVPAATLLELAAGEGRAKTQAYVQVKAIEALGRLREQAAAVMLAELLAPRKLWHRQPPRELRLAALQALAQIDPEQAMSLLPETRFDPDELQMGPLPPARGEWARQRRYPRVQPSKMNVLAVTQRGRVSLDVQRLSLGGGLLAADRRLPRGGDAVLEWQSGLSRARSHVVLRDVPTAGVAYEVVDIDLDSRSRLRRILLAHWTPAHGAGVTASQF